MSIKHQAIAHAAVIRQSMLTAEAEVEAAIKLARDNDLGADKIAHLLAYQDRLASAHRRADIAIKAVADHFGEDVATFSGGYTKPPEEP